MNEVSYYEEFSKKFRSYLSTYLSAEYRIYYSCNKTLDNIIVDLEEQSGLDLNPEKKYIPKLKLDIVFVLWSPKSSPHLILIEAKYLEQLSLKDYSQLVGYLQVAKTINLGLLLLIQRKMSLNNLSYDFKEIVRLKKLPMNWKIELMDLKEEYAFRTGILNYTPGNGIEWVDTREVNGISSFEELVAHF